MSTPRARGRIGFAHVASALALVFALSGTAYAGALITGRDIRDGSVTGKDVKNGTLTGTDVRDGSLSKADLASGIVPVPPGATLPPGTTLRGVFAPYNSSSSPTGPTTAGESVSFAYPLPSGPRVHVMPSTAAPTADCPGSVAQPEAAAGQLCLYLQQDDPAHPSQIVVLDPTAPDLSGINYHTDTDSETVFGEGKVARFGFKLTVQTASNISQLAGSWAATS